MLVGLEKQVEGVGSGQLQAKEALPRTSAGSLVLQDKEYEWQRGKEAVDHTVEIKEFLYKYNIIKRQMTVL